MLLLNNSVIILNKSFETNWKKILFYEVLLRRPVIEGSYGCARLNRDKVFRPDCCNFCSIESQIALPAQVMTGSACPMSQGMPVEVHLLRSHRPHLVTWSYVIAGRLDSIVSLFFWAILYSTTTPGDKYWWSQGEQASCSGTLFRPWARLVLWRCPRLLGFLCGSFHPRHPGMHLGDPASDPSPQHPPLTAHVQATTCCPRIVHLPPMGLLLLLPKSSPHHSQRRLGKMRPDQLSPLFKIFQWLLVWLRRKPKSLLCPPRSVGLGAILTDFICMSLVFTRLQSYLPPCCCPTLPRKVVCSHVLCTQNIKTRGTEWAA